MKDTEDLNNMISSLTSWAWICHAPPNANIYIIKVLKHFRGSESCGIKLEIKNKQTTIIKTLKFWELRKIF